MSEQNRDQNFNTAKQAVGTSAKAGAKAGKLAGKGVKKVLKKKGIKTPFSLFSPKVKLIAGLALCGIILIGILVQGISSGSMQNTYRVNAVGEQNDYNKPEKEEEASLVFERKNALDDLKNLVDIVHERKQEDYDKLSDKIKAGCMIRQKNNGSFDVDLSIQMAKYEFYEASTRHPELTYNAQPTENSDDDSIQDNNDSIVANNTKSKSKKIRNGHYIGQATSTEKGGTTGGKAGDQTGEEVSIKKWYKNSSYGNWNYVVRCKDPNKAAIMAEQMEYCCNNNHIGYDQSDRKTLYKEASKVGWDCSKIKNDCETTCTEVLVVCARAAGIKIKNASTKSIYCGNIISKLKKTGQFEFYTSTKYTKSYKKLKRGDFIINTNHHSCMYLSGSTAKEPSTNTSKKGTVKNGTVMIGQAATADKAGKKGDQSGKEVAVSKWSYSSNSSSYNHWTHVIRCTDTSKASQMASNIVSACNNDHIGYAKSHSKADCNEYYKNLKKANWNPSAIKKNCDTVCTPFISCAIRAVGYKSVGDCYHSDTYLVKWAKKQSNWKVYTTSSLTSKSSNLKVGDILVSTKSSAHHGCMVVSTNGKKGINNNTTTTTKKAKNIRLGQAACDYDHKLGDGNGKEVSTCKWEYNKSKKSYKNWTYVFRFKDPNKAIAAAKMMEKGIANDNIGYSGNWPVAKKCRKLAKAVNYDLSKIKQKTGCACGGIVSLAVKSTGINMSMSESGLGVAKSLKALSKDFTCYSSSDYVAKKDKLQVGDILVTAHSNGKNNHVVMVVSGNNPSGSSQNSNSLKTFNSLKTLKTIKKSTGSKKELGVNGNTYSVAQSFAYDGSKYYVQLGHGGGNVGAIAKYNSSIKKTSEKYISEVGHGNGLTYYSNADILYSVNMSNSKTIKKINTTNLKTDGSTNYGCGASGISFDKSTGMMVIQEGGTIHVYDAKTKKEKKKFREKRTTTHFHQDICAANGVIFLCSCVSKFGNNYIDMYRESDGKYAGSYHVTYGELEDIEIINGNIVLLVHIKGTGYNYIHFTKLKAPTNNTGQTAGSTGNDYLNTDEGAVGATKLDLDIISAFSITLSNGDLFVSENANLDKKTESKKWEEDTTTYRDRQGNKISTYWSGKHRGMINYPKNLDKKLNSVFASGKQTEDGYFYKITYADHTESFVDTSGKTIEYLPITVTERGVEELMEPTFGLLPDEEYVNAEHAEVYKGTNLNATMTLSDNTEDVVLNGILASSLGMYSSGIVDGMRLSYPELTNPYYFSATYNAYYGVYDAGPTSCYHNCTWYAYGRYNEIAGRKVTLPSGIAVDFYRTAQGLKLKTGKVAQPGSIIVYDKGYYGHVAVVEKIFENGDLLTSQSAYNSMNNGLPKRPPNTKEATYKCSDKASDQTVYPYFYTERVKNIGTTTNPKYSSYHGTVLGFIYQ